MSSQLDFLTPSLLRLNILSPVACAEYCCLYTVMPSCKIFEHFALQVDPVIEFIQPGSTPFKDSTILVPKLADPPFWWNGISTPSKTGSGSGSTHILYYSKMFV